MKKLFLLLLITTCLPVYAQEPVSTSGTFEQQLVLKCQYLDTKKTSRTCQKSTSKSWFADDVDEKPSKNSTLQEIQKRTVILIKCAKNTIENVRKNILNNQKQVKD